MRAYAGKRSLDVFLVVLFSPAWVLLFLVTGLFVRLTIGRPVFFCQRRAGLNGTPFKLIKFRTMTDDRDTDGELLPDEERMPAAGRFLRSTSLDELPEFLNVLRGDMSLVGPRPLPEIYVGRYSSEQVKRLSGRPGLTGLAQVNGRNAISWERRFQLDVEYLERQSLWLDVVILMKTLDAVFRRTGISGPDSVTMPEFMGTHDGHPASERGRDDPAQAHNSES